MYSQFFPFKMGKSPLKSKFKTPNFSLQDLNHFACYLIFTTWDTNGEVLIKGRY